MTRICKLDKLILELGFPKTITKKKIDILEDAIRLRREISMTKPGPGKFQANDILEIAEALQDICSNGAMDDMFGDNSAGLGWYALIIRDQRDEIPVGDLAAYLTSPAYIVEEDTSGFFTYEEFDTIEAAKNRFEEIRLTRDVDVEP
jgi:hypothetical protein